jgi:hypothetical protein
VSDLPGHFWLLENGALVAFFAGVCAVLYTGTIGTGGSRSAAFRLAATAGILSGSWLLAITLLAENGVYEARPGGFPWIAPTIIMGVAAVLLAARIPAVATALSHPRAAVWLTALQFVRVIGVVFVLAFAIDRLPPVFAIPVGCGDLAVGIAAPFVARRLARDPSSVKGAALFNRLGMLDLILSVPLGVLASPAIALFGPNTTINMGLLPLAIIPMVGVPSVFAVHLLALRRLRHMHRDSVVPEAIRPYVPATGRS